MSKSIQEQAIEMSRKMHEERKDSYDFKGALEALYDNGQNTASNLKTDIALTHCEVSTIQFALKLADRLQSGDISPSMRKIGLKAHWVCNAYVEMTKQLMKEVEDDT